MKTQNLINAQEEGANIIAFMKSEEYIRFQKGASMKSTELYIAYVSWCEANLEKPRARTGFLHYIRKNQKLKLTNGYLCELIAGMIEKYWDRIEFPNGYI